jgi:acyl-coenzyme A synthetase/AMP-(fatty) acid ligase
MSMTNREEDVIVRDGYDVYSREVEEALAAHPAVLQKVAVAEVNRREEQGRWRRSM